MTRSFATAVGMGSLMLLAVLGVNAVQATAGSSGAFPQQIVSITIAVAAILANTYMTYKIVRGSKPDPSYTREELTVIVEDAVERRVAEQIEIFGTRMARLGLINDVQQEIPSQPRPRPASVVNLHRTD